MYIFTTIYKKNILEQNIFHTLNHKHNKMKRYIYLIFCLLTPFIGKAGHFNRYFVEKTLRIDYIFSGNAHEQQIYLDELYSLPQWAGRRSRMDEIPLEGNGEIVMRNKANNRVIYRTSFSSLFQEWIAEKEAQTTQRAFENSFLLPYPKDKAIITISLKDHRHQTVCSFSHEIDPDDILIHKLGEFNVTPHQYILKSGSFQDCIDIAIMAEGYTEEEMDKFYQKAKEAYDALFAHEPFKTFRNKFNVVAVASASEQSGVSIPREGKWISTAVGSHFDTFYSDRYLTTRRVKSIHNHLAGIPYEHIIILANTDTYGGGGIYNSYTLTAAGHSTFKAVVVHEFGHSFGGLADEYAYSEAPSPLFPYDVEPWEPNITTLVNFGSKWKDMLPPHTPIPTKPEAAPDKKYSAVGVYEGAGYSLKGIYRPCTECRMKINEAPSFCPVCQRALKRIIKFYTE